MALQSGVVGEFKQDDEGEEKEAGDSFWLQIMAECVANYPNRLPSSKSLLILGDNDAQKTQLIAKLQGTTGEKQRRGNGLEYYFLTVRDEYCENQTKLDVWVLDDDTSFRRLLKYVVNENTLSDTTVILMATMTKPWEIFRSMCTWIEILQEHINSLDIPKEVLDEQKSKVLRRYQEYVEPTMSIYGNLDEQSNSTEIEINLGVEIMVVITQTEYMSTLQAEFGYIEEHFDFIQLSLRKFCLTYGAALFYVSLKEDRNCDILLKYILHKIYSFPFRIPAMFLEKDSIFVPAGWDTENKILALAESLATIAFTAPFEEVIVKPGRLSDINRALVEVVAQNDQDFLLALQNALLRQPVEQQASDYGRDSSVSGTITARNPPRRLSRSPQKKQLEAKLASGEGDTVLQSFFKSLLKRQTSAPAERPTGMPSGSRAQDPSGAHFDRSTSLENTSSAHNKANLGSRSLGASIDSSAPQNTKDIESLEALDELKPSNEFNSRVRRDVTEKTTETDVGPFAEFMKKYKAQVEFKNREQTSVEDEEEDIRQLPEYFMSSSSSAHCPEDCCYQENSTKSNGNYDMDMDCSLDRVTSTYNPPLRLLLETSHNGSSSRKGKASPKGSSCSSTHQSSFGVGHSASESSIKDNECEETGHSTSSMASGMDRIVDEISLKKDVQMIN